MKTSDLKNKKVIILIDGEETRAKVKCGVNLIFLQISHLWWKKKIILTQELIEKIVKIKK